MTENPDQTQTEQPTEQDDEIIGVAFRVSLLIIAIAAAIGVTAFYFATREQPEGPTTDAPPVTALRQIDAPAPPAVSFADITVESGLDFVHRNGAAGEKLLPETMGGGCAFLDYDNDGDQDILLVSGRAWQEEAGAESSSSLALFANDGAGRFSNVTEEAGLDAVFYGMGVAIGDVDNDGDADVFVTAVGPNFFFRNDGGSFVDATADAGVAGEDDEWSSSAGFFDADNDGDLDLFVCNYVRWSREIDFEVDYTMTGLGRAYGPPTNFEGTNPYFYVNDGDGRFTEMGESAGLHVINRATGARSAKSLAVIFPDVDGDGLSEIVVANDTTRNFLFRNLGGLRFEEIGGSSGLAFDSMGSSTGAMGIDSARFRGDNAFAVAIGNFANEMTSFYVADADVWQFIDTAIVEGVGAPSRAALSFGLFFFDYDLDGRLDLFQTNGHIEDDINKVQPSQQYRQPSQLFWHTGGDDGPTYVLVGSESVGDLSTPVVGRGAAYADIDADGDLDILVTQIADRPLLLRNEQDISNNWVRIAAEGAGANRSAIGARIVVRTGERTIERVVQPTRSYLSQVELPVTIGLGEAATIDEVVVHWPGGGETRLTDIRPGRLLTVRQDASGS